MAALAVDASDPSQAALFQTASQIASTCVLNTFAGVKTVSGWQFGTDDSAFGADYLARARECSTLLLAASFNGLLTSSKYALKVFMQLGVSV